LKKYSSTDKCPVKNVVDRIGDKWSVLVLMLLEESKVLRFNEIYGYVEAISQKMLAVTLKNIEADGLVKRTVYPQIPPKVEYELTKRGRTLLPHLHSIINWAKTNMNDIIESRERYSKVQAKIRK
jgi:DNA-binding HxlR family transcriptional regulator